MERIQDICRGKRIAIVGNAESLQSLTKANEIDAHDVVVRMNKGVMASPDMLSKHLGYRCDIYAFSGKGYAPEEAHQTEKPSVSVWMTTRKREKAPEHVEFFPEKMWNNLQMELATLSNVETEKEIRPSTGLMVVYMILKGVDYKWVDIYGFDFWQTKTFYNKKTINPNRSIQPLAEKLLMEKMLVEHSNVTIIRAPVIDQYKNTPTASLHFIPQFLRSMLDRLFGEK